MLLQTTKRILDAELLDASPNTTLYDLARINTTAHESAELTRLSTTLPSIYIFYFTILLRV